jgi:hypothetical protein
MTESYIHLHGNIYIALQAFSSEYQFSDNEVVVVSARSVWHEIEGSTSKEIEQLHRIAFPTLRSVILFHHIAKKIEGQNRSLKIIFRVEDLLEQQVWICFLLGCHLVVSHGMGFEETILSFKPLHQVFDQFSVAYGISFEQSLRAFCAAKCLNWIDFEVSPTLGPSSLSMIDNLVHENRSVRLFLKTSPDWIDHRYFSIWS